MRRWVLGKVYIEKEKEEEKKDYIVGKVWLRMCTGLGTLGLGE